LAATTHRTRPGAVAPPSIPARNFSSEHSNSTATAATVEAVVARAATDLVRCWSTANARHLAVSHTTSKGVESAPLSTLPVAVDAPATCAPPPRPGSEAPPDAMAGAELLDWCGRPDRPLASWPSRRRDRQLPTESEETTAVVDFWLPPAVFSDPVVRGARSVNARSSRTSCTRCRAGYYLLAS
jgi:hypothetical protein